ncbi:MAG: right-handed parallel beta-helix repeat-containing protein [Patescibacteria group bacterium]
MKHIMTFIFVVIFIVGLFVNPVFVLAGDKCVICDGEDCDYETISEAIEENCDKIEVKKGTYKEDVVVDKGVSVSGDDRSDVVITGKVTMKDGAKLSDVTVSGMGIDVLASAKIEYIKVKDSRIGIDASGGGTLEVKKADVYDNDKGMYIQRGKDIKITGSEVYNNKEEGIDIRANVDGTVSGNVIYNNGESGIEVILGKSELKITNNTIKKNAASGIATQFYKEASKLGALIITGNSVTENKDYGINCKIPSGGNPEPGYWMNSMKMSANKISNNKDGEFAESCKFDVEKIEAATKTIEEVEAE